MEKSGGTSPMWTQNDRHKVITSIRKLVPEKHINVLNPDQDYRQWLAFVDSRSRDLLETERGEDFEAGVRALLAALDSSHTAFFRESDRIPRHMRSTPHYGRSRPETERAGCLSTSSRRPRPSRRHSSWRALTGADGQSISPPEQVNFVSGQTTNWRFWDSTASVAPAR